MLSQDYNPLKTTIGNQEDEPKTLGTIEEYKEIPNPNGGNLDTHNSSVHKQSYAQLSSRHKQMLQ